MSSLRKLIEEAQTIIVQTPAAKPPNAVEDPKFSALLIAIRALKNNPDLDKLTNEQLGILRTLLHTVVFSATMTSRAAQMHLRAAYTAAAKEALLKLGESGKAIISALEPIVDAATMVGPKEPGNK